MKLFGRTGGYWLFWVSAVYVLAGAVDFHFAWPVRLEFVQLAYVLAISLPLWIPPMARYLHMKCIWEI